MVAFRGSAGSAGPPSAAPPAPPGNSSYWLVASDGGVFTFGNALLRLHGRQAAEPADRGHGAHGGRRAVTGWRRPTVGSSTSATPASTALRAAPTGRAPWSAWPATPDGRRLLAGGLRRWRLQLRRRRLLRLRGRQPLNKPIVGMATPNGLGYWLVASDGGVFSFGDARFYGSDGRQASEPAHRGDGSHPRRSGLLAGGLRRGHLRFRRRRFYGSGAARRCPAPSAWKPPPTDWGTGSGPPTVASSTSATPSSTALRAGPAQPAGSRDRLGQLRRRQRRPA